METEKRIGELAWQPKSAVFRRKDGTTWMRYRREYILKVRSGGVPNMWISEHVHERLDPYEVVTVLDL
jgi:hypothetical protein